MEANLCLCSRFEWKRIFVCVVVVNGSESVFYSLFVISVLSLAIPLSEGVR
jgi:hypothetical protein